MNPEDLLKFFELTLAKIEVKNLSVKVLSDNKIIIKEGNNTFNINVTNIFQFSEDQFRKKFPSEFELAKQRIGGIIENDPKVSSEISHGIPTQSLASYLQGTVSANATLSALNPNQGTLIPEPGTFEQTHRIDFEQDENGEFRTLQGLMKPYLEKADKKNKI
ncbi:MAG: hypothetical protein A2Y57_02415 [Candidatus Woykebacteria bacterium RBG_13_40_7b]|uniref:Uncharacterized protein n=1 Tax=Candidatus Woykebacteria bacterium RBG_13_40_7b TaxID=1802594 RepID=A0A1G1WBG1_9BACT|nr:MAG: hypothetical protein A2Y57_02415 [Candidatus Woykebacteria bacterium RBG_13_40_7b]